MIDIKVWTDMFLQRISECFGSRVWFAGIQGSYARGEATDKSDIDMVVVLDSLSVEDIKAYDSVLDSLPHRELICGFLSGKSEIMGWDPSDLFQFYFDTKPLWGSLDELLPLIRPADIKRAVKVGAGNIYHGCVHNMLYEKSHDLLRGLYKSASFVIQAVCFLETGKYISHLSDLASSVSIDDAKIIRTFMELKNGGNVKFEEMSEALFYRAKALIENTDLL